MNNMENRKSTHTNYAEEDDGETVQSEDNPKTVRVELNPSVIVEERLRWRTFIVGTAAYLNFLMIPLLIALILRLFSPDTLKRIYHQNAIAQGWYAILFFSIFICILITSSLIKEIPTRVKFGLIACFTACYWFLAGWVMRRSFKFGKEWYQYTVILYTLIICGAVGLMASVMVNFRRIKTRICAGVAVSLFIFLFLIYSHVYTNKFGENLIKPSLPAFMLFTLLCGFYASYLSMTLESMVKRRSHFFDYDDWFTGCINLHTDIYFRFWYELFTPEKEKEEYNEEEAEDAEGQRSREKTQVTEINL